MIKFRYISLLIRRIHSGKASKLLLQSFRQWKAELNGLPAPARSGKKLLLIRLDDIGDYLLFRNSLMEYKKSPRWREYEINLLGNIAWEEFFTALDSGAVDRTIWVNKTDYLNDQSYRMKIWLQLRQAGYETVICTSCTRPLLLDDLCMLAAGAENTLGSVNTFRHSQWNRLSDSLYTDLFRTEDPLIHEFYFNARFTEWSCGTGYPGKRPQIDYPFTRRCTEPYILCFIGANTRSRRWPVKRWIEFINLYQKYYPNRIILAGGKGEAAMAKDIQGATGARSIVGTVSLQEMIDWVSGSQAVITNNTMAAHLSAACNKPAVIIANGDNYIRFTEYGSAGIDNISTVYPEVFQRRRRRVGDRSLHYTAVSADIASIKALAVLNELEEILELNELIQSGVTGVSGLVGESGQPGTSAFKLPVAIQ